MISRSIAALAFVALGTELGGRTLSQHSSTVWPARWQNVQVRGQRVPKFFGKTFVRGWSVPLLRAGGRKFSNWALEISGRVDVALLA